MARYSTKELNWKDKRSRLIRSIVTVGSGIIVLFVVLYNIDRPIGEVIPEMGSRIHVTEGIDPGPYNSNPPTSGIHYETSLEAGFYEENIYQYAEGYLVHSLEHGYVIFWYNCSILSENECMELKTQIHSVMAKADNYKVIAFPWKKIDVPVAMTAWGRLLSMESFNADTALSFIKQNREKNPEPAGH